LLRGVEQLQHDFLPTPDAHVSLGISERHADFQIVMVQTPVTLLNTHLATVDGAVGIDPGPLIVTRRFNDKGVAFPTGGRISVPTRLCFGPRQLASVRPQVAPDAIPFEELHEFVLELHESVVTVVRGAWET